MISEQELTSWITHQVSQILMLPVDDIKPDIDLYELGLDSQDALSLISDLDKKIGTEFPATLIDENKTIEKIVSYISSMSTIEP